MTSRHWIELLERIPPQHHHHLVVQLAGGGEVILQAIVHLEEHFLIVRGRSAGSTEAGRVFFIPWERIQYLGLFWDISEEELRQMLGLPAASLATSLAVIRPADASPTPTAPPSSMSAADASLAPAVEPATASDTDRLKKTQPLSRSLLLARLRAKLAQEQRSETP
jgi:hypothetical protein